MAESSKKAARRALKQCQAIYASITRSRNRGIVITNEDSSSRSAYPNTQDTPNTQVTQESNSETKKKTRGVTRMVTLKVNQPVEVDFNLHGQTIDGSSITLASYIGIFAREHVLITLESWKKVDEQKKDMIWSSLLLLHSSKDYIFKKIGGRWRQYKSRITKKLIELLKPKNITNVVDWNEFIKQRTSEQFKHTTERMGYARLRHIMKNKAKEKGKDSEKITRVDVWIEGHKRKKNKPLSEAVQTTMDEINQLRESTCPPNDNNINEDSLAKVLGAKKRGRVRSLGFGATPSRVQTQIQSGGRVKQLEAELEATNDQVTSFKEMINMIMKQNDQLLNRGVQMEDATGSHVYTPPHVFTPQSQHGSVPITQDMSKFENARYHLLHWYPEDDSEDQIVAEGRISSINSKDKIHNMPLGIGNWRICGYTFDTYEVDFVVAVILYTTMLAYPTRYCGSTNHKKKNEHESDDRFTGAINIRLSSHREVVLQMEGTPTMVELNVSNIGTSIISTSLSCKTDSILMDVLYVPQIAKNLLSISKFTLDSNAYAEFTESCCILKDKSTKKVLLTKALNNGLYKLDFYCVRASSLPSSLQILLL
ncbi:hypothetical protein ACOSQ2_029098 [Xanthoceras sorbifolium]